MEPHELVITLVGGEFQEYLEPTESQAKLKAHDIVRNGLVLRHEGETTLIPPAQIAKVTIRRRNVPAASETL